MLLGVLAGCFWRPALRIAARGWVVSDQFSSADAVALSAGARAQSFDRAIDWFREHKVDRLVLLREETQPTDRAGITEPRLQWRLNELGKAGVPESALVVVGEELATMHSEMVALQGWVRSNRVTRVVLPASPFATRRKAWLVRRLRWPAGMQASVVAVAVPDYDVDHWWRTKEGLLAFEHECVLMAYYWCRY